jgi:hypothetical protein
MTRNAFILPFSLMNMYKKRVTFRIMLVYFFILALFLLRLSLAVTPSGANVNTLNSTSATAAAPSSVAAQAGNVSELNIFGYSVTQSWQGYNGNVTGAIQLADGSNFVMYNWSVISPQGEVFASTNSSIQWGNIQCFNFSARGNFSSDTAQAGGTSLYGINLTQLEAQYGIAYDDVDGVNETFTLSGSGTHDLFYVANQQFSEGECRNTRVYDNTGQGVSDHFEEALLYEPTSASVIFASLIEKDLFSYNNRTSDFEMLVLEDGHGTNVATTPYYFFVELQ